MRIPVIAGIVRASESFPPFPLWAEYVLIWGAPDAGQEADLEALPCHSLDEAVEEQSSWGGEIFEVERVAMVS